MGAASALGPTRVETTGVSSVVALVQAEVGLVCPEQIRLEGSWRPVQTRLRVQALLDFYT